MIALAVVILAIGVHQGTAVSERQRGKKWQVHLFTMMRLKGKHHSDNSSQSCELKQWLATQRGLMV
jgi:hypothetical protein